MLKVAEIIKSNIYHGVDLPVEVLHLVMLLKKPYESRFVDLWMMHAATKSDMEKADSYTKIYNIVQVVKAEDPEKYARILTHVRDSLDWRLSAIPNLHLHRLLRFRDHTTSVESTITSFLSSGIEYKPTLESQMTFRRNGGAHLFKNYGANVRGMRIAFKVALNLMIVHNPSIARALGKPVQTPTGLGVASVYTQPAFRPLIAGAIATAIASALAIPYVSEEVAMEAASAAANKVLSLKVATTTKANHAIARAATIAATLATIRLYSPPYPAKQLIPEDRFFAQDDTDKMFSLMAPSMLHELQYGAFVEGELSSAVLGGDGSSVKRLSAK